MNENGYGVLLLIIIEKITELISAVREDLDMKKLKEKVLATNDKKFITSVKKTLKDYEIEF